MKEKFQTIKRKHLKKRRAFTLVELIVVMAVIAVLTLLAVPKFMGYTKEARHTKLITNSRELEKASERYFMDHEDWPRLTDEPYTAEQVHEFAKRIYDVSGKEVTLDPAGNYYDIDYDRLSEYIKEPDDKMNYVLRNPVGKVYALEEITEVAKERANQVNPTDILFQSESITVTLGKTSQLELIFIPAETTVRKVNYTSSNSEVAAVDENGLISGKSIGSAEISVVSDNGKVTKTVVVTVVEPFSSKDFTYTGNKQTFIVPESGKYLLEVWGSQGASSTGAGGFGGYAKGEIFLTEGELLYIYNGGIGGFNGGGPSYGEGRAGGGATHIAKRDGELKTLENYKNDVLIVAGGGGGGSGYRARGGDGGGLVGGSGSYENKYSLSNGASQTAGGVGVTTNPSWQEGSSGTFGQGGTYRITSNRSSSGGGGWYGGGSGRGGYASGGGGSSYIGNVINGETVAGQNGATGKSKITFID